MAGTCRHGSVSGLRLFINVLQVAAVFWYKGWQTEQEDFFFSSDWRQMKELAETLKVGEVQVSQTMKREFETGGKKKCLLVNYVLLLIKRKTRQKVHKHGKIIEDECKNTVNG